MYTNNKSIFLGNSHGFRPYRGCHTAMLAVKRMRMVGWLLKEEIENCFNQINQKRLLNIIEEYIEDQKLQNILNKFFKAPIRYTQSYGFDSQIGTGISKENPFSPVLLNIFLHKFDVYVSDLKKEVRRGKLFNMHGHEAHCHLTRVSEEDIDIDGKTTKHTKKHQVKLMTQAEFCRYPIYDVSRLPFISSIRSKVSQGKNKVIYYKIY